MRVLLTNPVSKLNPHSITVDPVIGRHVGAKTKTGDYAPIGLGYVAAVLRNAGHDVEILDPTPQGYTWEKALEKARAFDYVFCPLAPSNAADMFEFFAALPDKRRIFFGTFASATADSLLEDDRCDVIVKGEPDMTAPDLVANWDRKESVIGISFKKDGRVVHNPPRPLLENLDTHPFPARDLIDNDLYTHSSFPGQTVGLILTSRGCPFGCNYCTTHLFYGRQWRFRSPENVVAELEEMVNTYHQNYIMVIDDTFTLSRDRVMRICDLIIQKGLTFTWSCLARPDKVINEALLRRMKEAGCVEVRYGVESGVQEILDAVDKGLTIEEIERAVALTKKVGLKQFHFYMLGNVGESSETIRRTIDFARRLDPDLASFNITTPFPGSYLFDQVKPEAKNYANFDTLHTNVSVCQLGIKQLRRELRKAYLRFYVRPKYAKRVAGHVFRNPLRAPKILLHYLNDFRTVMQ